MEITFKMGELQTLWVKSLREHPERQMTKKLGMGTPRNYKACCLGELHLCYHRMKGKKLPFYDDSILDNIPEYPNFSSLGHSYEKYGLFSTNGQRIDKERIYINKKSASCLADANDMGITWVEIADYIEANADQIFTHSV